MNAREQAHEDLLELARRRAQLARDEEVLKQDTEKAVARARAAKMNVTDIARVLGLDRSYLYKSGMLA
jgi:transcriptional regulator of acetoin/glycerol metabolism